jgi:hypothetical protein
MNKPTPIVFGLIGTLAFLVSALRPQLLGEAARFVRWHHDWR